MCSSQKISPFLKEKLVFLGQLDCYERASEIAEFVMNVKTNDTAIYRLTDEIGSLSESLISDHDFRQKLDLKQDEELYVQCDGSMLLTREQGWKEVKLGRVFRSSSILPQDTNRQWVKESEYVGHYGSHVEFEDKMSMLIDDTYKDSPQRVVFISDGAKWQWNWCEAEYPQAVKIIDFYHVMEHIGGYLHHVTKTREAREKYMSKLGSILKVKGIKTVKNYLEKFQEKAS